jgi:WhiB family redox-sensing transcriptional regulator
VSSTIDAYQWMDQAECKDMDLSEHDPFDPPSGGRYQSFVDEALAICARCNVREECLTDALQQRDVHGVKGGKTGPERADLLAGLRVPKQRDKESAPKRVDTRTSKEKYANESAEARERRRIRARENNAAYRARRRDSINARNRERYWDSKSEELEVEDPQPVVEEEPAERSVA